PKQTLERYPEGTTESLWRRLRMPVPLVEAALAHLSAARTLHFGFEEDRTSCLYKVYLEFDGRNAIPGSTFLMHLGCKWDVADNSRHVLTHYHWYPFLSVPEIVERLAQLYRDNGGGEPFELVREVLNVAAARPDHRMTYLEVSEPTTDRRSFDLNVYDALLRVQDLERPLSRMREYFAIPESQFRTWYQPIKVSRFGHLSGGVHREGQKFFNLYYGVQWRDGKAVPGFGEASADPHARSTPVTVPLPPRERSASGVAGESEAGGRSGVAMTSVERLELTTDQDQYFNYCWWPYVPVAPAANKLRPVSLLFQSFELAGVGPRAFELVRLLREAIGAFRTVWGVKWVGGRLAWEFYFYDYQRREREVSMTRVLDAIRPIIRSAVRPNESLGYFMFSLDVNEDLLSGARDLDVIHMYIGNPGSRVSSGIAYALTATTTALENFYFFFDARRDLREAAEKVYSSVYVDAPRMDIDRILRPELRDCNTICVANKQRNDTAYFSGIRVDQLLFFLRLLEYPSAIIQFVETNRGALDHLLYDVGFDYVTEGDELVMLKSGYYGVF
ncbi:MAG TPA: hypothetical protein VGF55_26655, partial [Gemmataceae bacterium]